MSPIAWDERLISHRYADLSGIRMHYVEAGEGPLVVLLHGFPEFWYSWRHQIPALAKAGYRVVAPDLRGYNLSDKPPRVDDYRIEALAGDVAQLIRALGEERATVVGHDWGGGVAWAFAMEHAEMLERLVIVNLPHPETLARGLRTPRQLVKSWYMIVFQLPAVPERVIRLGNYAQIRHAFNDLVKQGVMNAVDIERYIEALDRPGALTAAINYYRAAFRSGLLTRRFPRIDTPTLVIWGMRDIYLGSELAAPNPALVPNARVERIDDAGHFVQIERPDEVNRHLLAFLKS